MEWIWNAVDNRLLSLRPMYHTEAAAMDRIYQITKTLFLQPPSSFSSEGLEGLELDALHLYTLLLRLANGLCIANDEQVALATLIPRHLLTTKVAVSQYPVLFKELETTLQAYITRHRKKLEDDKAQVGVHYLALTDAGR